MVCATVGFAVDGQYGAIDIAGINKVTAIDANLTGSGVSIGLVCRSNTYEDSFPQNDYRPDITHKCLQNSKINFYDDQYIAGANSNHSTQIASILVGSDSNAFYPALGNFSYKSAAPAAQLKVYEFWYFITENVFSGQWPKDDLLTMSLGSSTEAWWSRGIDEMVERYGFLVVAAIGNGTDAYDLPLYPAACTNVLAVGVVDSNNSLTEFHTPDASHSTAGPTLDGRCKPDIVAPGNCLTAISNVNEPYRPSGDYSSFAAPVVAGVASILIQKAKSDPNLQIAASGFSGNCVLKSILMTSADKLVGWHKGAADNNDDSEYPLDFKQGAGMVDALSAYNLLVAGLQHDGDVNAAGWDINLIDSSAASEKVYRFAATAGDAKKLTATLVWNRSYEVSYPFNLNMNLWNDLRLTLRKIDADGQISVADISDSPVDNVEHIYINLEPDSTYELTVSNSPNYESKDTAIYALSWTTK
ncbi:MAG: S8 family serine peptidase [Planctomycetaceae bacterium]|nr:S8 family serine peptidase [Planctomycetaceae bacterium]